MTRVTPPLLFDRAIANGQVEEAVEAAKQFKNLSLDRALELTILFGRTDDRRYEQAARKFLTRFIEEQEPSLTQLRKVVDALENLAATSNLPALRYGADDALEELARQIRARRR